MSTPTLVPFTGSPAADGRRRERRGLRTVGWAFLLCPCHLPITLTLLGIALGGTAAGAFLRDHAWVAGGVITLGWVALTWRGLWLVRHGTSCPVPQPGGFWRRARPGRRAGAAGRGGGSPGGRPGRRSPGGGRRAAGEVTRAR